MLMNLDTEVDMIVSILCNFDIESACLQNLVF